MKKFILTLSLFLGTIAAGESPSVGFPEGWSEVTQTGKVFVASLETFGSPRLKLETLKKFLGPSLDQWIHLGLKNDPREQKVVTELAYRIFQKYQFAYVGWSVTQFYNEGESPVYITLDVVERQEVGHRMPFRDTHVGPLPDPSGLLQAWEAYDQAGRGKPATDRSLTSEASARACRSFFCLHGHVEPRLEKYQALFLAGVPSHWNELRRIASEDSRPTKRRAATYLLAYSPQAAKVVEELLQRLHDPSDSVREAALMVFRAMSLRPDVFIPVPAILPVLHYPREAERVLAAFTIYNLMQQSDLARSQVREAGLNDCLALSRMAEPRAKNIGSKILREISVSIDGTETK